MIELKNIDKSFGDLKVLKNINLKIDKGQVVSIIGSSGTGKSTLLRCINFLEKPDNGVIILDECMVNVQDATQKDIHTLRQNTAMVFQKFNLFKNKTILENITEGLITVKKLDKKTAKQRGENILKQVGLIDKKHNYPITLSGGQQQRVAIGRAMAMEPKIILFDEPTSALDPELVNYVLELIKELSYKKMTMLIVTHEINFARSVSDTVCFMQDGTIIEQGSPKEVIDNPKNKKTQDFLRFIKKE